MHPDRITSVSLRLDWVSPGIRRQNADRFSSSRNSSYGITFAASCYRHHTVRLADKHAGCTGQAGTKALQVMASYKQLLAGPQAAIIGKTGRPYSPRTGRSCWQATDIPVMLSCLISPTIRVRMRFPYIPVVSSPLQLPIKCRRMSLFGLRCASSANCKHLVLLNSQSVGYPSLCKEESKNHRFLQQMHSR